MFRGNPRDIAYENLIELLKRYGIAEIADKVNDGHPIHDQVKSRRH